MIFWYTPFYIESIIYLAKIVRALSSNKIVFFAFLQKVNNSIATKLCVKLIYNCNVVFEKWLTTQFNEEIVLCIFKYESKLKIGWEK